MKKKKRKPLTEEQKEKKTIYDKAYHKEYLKSINFLISKEDFKELKQLLKENKMNYSDFIKSSLEDLRKKY